MSGNINGNVNQLLRSVGTGERNGPSGVKHKSSVNKSISDKKQGVFGTGIGQSATVEFSKDVEMYGKVVDMLQRKYENADVFVAGPNDDTSQIGGDLEYSIILTEDEMRTLASDEPKDKDAKDILLGKIDKAMKTISEMSKEIESNTDENDEIANFGLSIGKDGKINFFADINGNSYKDTSIDSIVKQLVADKSKSAE